MFCVSIERYARTAYEVATIIAMQCTNDLLSLQQYMFNFCSIAGTVADLFYIVFYYDLLNYMLYGHTNSMSMVQPGN